MRLKCKKKQNIKLNPAISSYVDQILDELGLSGADIRTIPYIKRRASELDLSKDDIKFVLEMYKHYRPSVELANIARTSDTREKAEQVVKPASKSAIRRREIQRTAISSNMMEDV